MAMQSPAPVPALVFDDDLGDASARRLRELVSQGRVADAQAWLDTVHNWDARLFYVDAVSRWPDRPAWLDAWVAQASQRALPLLVRADHSIHAAWSHRGSGWDAAAGSEQAFAERLGAADADLGQAAVIEAMDPTAYCLMLRVARGRRLPLSEKQERFQQMCARDPGHRRGHTEMLRCLSEKWGGSHDLMFQFARETAARAQPGSPLFTLIAEAHVERWLTADREGAERDYWQRPDVAAEIRSAASACFDSPQFRQTPLTVVDRSHFAFCFVQMGDWTAAKQQLVAMPVPYRWPWAMFGDPAALLTAARQQALAGG